MYGGFVTIASQHPFFIILFNFFISSFINSTFFKSFNRIDFLDISYTSFCISTPIIFFALIFLDNKILIIPVPLPRSKTVLLSFISFAKSDNRTLSIPKQNQFLF